MILFILICWDESSFLCFKKTGKMQKKYLPFLTCPTLFVWYWYLSPTFSFIYQQTLFSNYSFHFNTCCICYMLNVWATVLLSDGIHVSIHVYIYHPPSSWQIYAKHLKYEIEPSHNSLPSEAWSTVQYFSTYIYFLV